MGLMRRAVSSRAFWCVVVLAIVWVGTRAAIAGLALDPRFDALPEWRSANGPAWADADVVRPVLERLDRLGPVNLFSPSFEAQVRGAFEEVPGVRTVHRIRRIWPDRYAVSFSMHRPYAVIERHRDPLPVTRDAVVLPLEPYAERLPGLLRIRGLAGVAAVSDGRAWNDERLLDALATIEQVAPHVDAELAPLGIGVIDVSRARDPREGVLLRGRDGIVIRWGRPRAEVGENSVEKKLELLLTAAAHPDQVRGFEFDIRFEKPYLRKSAEP